GTVDSEVATVSINVTSANNPPVAQDQSITTDEDAATAVMLTGSDLDGDDLTYTIVSGPTNGILTGNAPDLIYTPSENYNGADIFTYQVNDGELDSNIATVSIVVNSGNDLPIAEDVTITIDANDQESLTLIGSDSETAASDLKYVLLTQPTSVNLSGEAPNLVATREINSSSTEVVFYRVFDGESFSEPATITINVVEKSFLVVDAGEDKSYVFEEVYQGGDFTLPAGGESQALGKDFWVCFPISADFENEQHKILISSEVNTTVTISTNSEVLGNIQVVAGTVQEFIVPAEYELTASSTGIEDKGIHIESLDDISVYVVNLISAASEAYLALPTSIAGKEYYAASYDYLFRTGTLNPNRYPSVTVLATEDDTSVTVTAPLANSGRTYDVLLNKGQTYTYEASSGNYNESGEYVVDITGAHVVADKPVNVFGAHECAYIPVGIQACDHLVEQFPSVQHWGNEFLTAPFATRTSGDIFRIIASEYDTEVYIDGVLVNTIASPGGFYEYSLNKASIVQSSSPSMLVQYSKGAFADSEDNTVGDPSMMFVPAINQYASKYVVQHEEFNFDDNYINITGTEFALNDVRIDGELLDPNLINNIEGSSYFHAQVPVEAGTHIVAGSLPFGCFVYGFGYFDAYSYPAGFGRLRGNLNTRSIEVDEIQVSVNSLELEQFESCHLTIKLFDKDGNPVANAEAVVQITGSQNLSRSVVSNSNGEALYSFQGTNHGATTIEILSGAQIDALSVNWLPKWFDLNGEISASDSGQLVSWQYEGSEDGVVIENISNLNTRFSVSHPGTYTFTLAINDDQDSVSYKITAIPEVQVDAGENVTCKLGEIVTLSGSVLSNHDYEDLITDVEWQLVSGGDGVEIISSQSLETQVQFTEPGTYTFKISSLASGDFDTVTLEVTNDSVFYEKPIAYDYSYKVNPEVGNTVTLIGDVTNGYTAEYIINSQPLNGTLSGTPPNLNYQPNNGYFGTDLFTYQIHDGREYSDIATIDLTIYDSVQTPQITNSPEVDFVISEEILNGIETSPSLISRLIYEFDCDAVDPQGEAISYSVISGPSNLVVDNDSGLVTWNTNGYNQGVYSYEIKATNESGHFDVRDYEVNLVHDEIPVIILRSFSALQGETITIEDLVVDDFPENLELTYGSGRYASEVELLDNGFIYTPINASFADWDFFTISVNDGVNSTQSYTIRLNYSGVYEPNSVSFDQTFVEEQLGDQYTYTQTPTVVGGSMSSSQLSYEWKILAGASGAEILDPYNNISRVSFPTLGLYSIEVTVRDGISTSSAQYDIQVGFEDNIAPVIDLEEVYELNLSNSKELLITPDFMDNPSWIGAVLDIDCKLLSGSAVDITVNNDDGSSLIKFAYSGDYTFEVSASDGEFVTTETTEFIVTQDENSSPSVYAGNDLVLQSVGSFILNGTASDDGLPSPLGTIWSMLEGPAEVTIENPSSLDTVIILDTYGTYRFALTASDGEFTVSDELTVTILDTASPTTLSAGDDFTFQMGSESSFSLNGLLTGSAIATEWIMVSGYEGTEFSDPSSLTSEVTPSYPGTYIFGLQAENNPYVAADTVTVTVESAPFVEIYNPLTGSGVLENTGFTLSVDAYDLSGALTSVEIFQNGAVLGDATALGNGYYTYYVTGGLPLGEYEFTASATSSNGVNRISAPVSIVIYEEGNAPLPVLYADFDIPEIVDSELDIIGDAYGSSFINYTVSYREYANSEAEWLTLADNTAQIVDDHLASFDPSLLENGVYEMRLQVFGDGGSVMTAVREFILDSELKLGQFALAFEDLSVPLSGLPISVTRAYDSRDQSIGDFGQGWELGLQSMSVRTVGIVGANWSQQRVVSGFFQSYRLSAANSSKVMVKLPGGEIETFTPIVEGGGVQQFSPITSGNLAFEAVDDAEGSLSILGNSFFGYYTLNGSVFDDFSYGVLIDPFTAEAFNPTQFLYTDKAGNEYQISIEDGLFGLKDTNDNTLTFDDNGVYHSDGESITYTRNADGLITAITDPAGEQLLYRYNGNQLIEFENRVGEVTQFFYEEPRFPNYLTRIVDPA
ncbi:MAG: Ig-like domain-containing protein, partial [Bacteroidota bacterium]